MCYGFNNFKEVYYNLCWMCLFWNIYVFIGVWEVEIKLYINVIIMVIDIV